jgi:acylphosphatase
MTNGTHVIVKGRVQGVFFRDYTSRQAKELGLSGWVQNLPDGTVEALFIGKESTIRIMLKWLETGSPASQVDNIVSTEIEVDARPVFFEIRYR